MLFASYLCLYGARRINQLWVLGAKESQTSPHFIAIQLTRKGKSILTFIKSKQLNDTIKQKEELRAEDDSQTSKINIISTRNYSDPFPFNKIKASESNLDQNK